VKNIFVGNLDFDTTEDELRQLFAAYGAVDRVTLMRDRDTGQPRGFGFVEIASAEDGNKAIAALNGTKLHGRPEEIGCFCGRHLYTPHCHRRWRILGRKRAHREGHSQSPNKERGRHGRREIVRICLREWRICGVRIPVLMSILTA